MTAAEAKSERDRLVSVQASIFATLIRCHRNSADTARRLASMAENAKARKAYLRQARRADAKAMAAERKATR